MGAGVGGAAAPPAGEPPAGEIGRKGQRARKHRPAHGGPLGKQRVVPLPERCNSRTTCSARTPGQPPRSHSAPHHAAASRCRLAALGADEKATNRDNLTPLQLAAQKGLRCTQEPVTSKDIFEAPAKAKESKESQSIFCFILELNSDVRWTFGNVISTVFAVEQLHGPRGAASVGTSCLKLVCDEQQLDVLCPSAQDSHTYVRRATGGGSAWHPLLLRCVLLPPAPPPLLPRPCRLH